MENNNEIKNAIEANIEVHSKLASAYNKNEPHFRPESISRVEEIIKSISKTVKIENALDLGTYV